MKKHILILISTLLISSCIYAQNHFTPYDNIPGVMKSYKPSYNDQFPEWAKMLYQYPINYFEIQDAYQKYSLNNKVKKNAISRYYKIWNKAIINYVKDDGSIYIPNLKDYQENLWKTQNTQTSQPSKTNSSWTFLGPKETFWLNESGSPTTPLSCPWQVNLYSFDISLSNPNILYCGTETGFVNKTTDKGLTWEFLVSDYFFGGGVTATAIHPTNPDIVYVSAGNQIHKTTDGGNSWAPLLQSGDQFSADRLVIDLDNPETIFAAATNGVYKTIDGGQSWDRHWTQRAYDVAINTADENLVYAISRTAGNFQIIYSTDGGNTFDVDNNFPTDITDESGGLLAVTPADPNALWVVMLSADYTPYLYKGNMSNGYWDLIATGQTSEFGMNNGQGYFDLAIEVSPLDENLIFAATTTLFKSTNGGQNFHAIGGYTGSFAIHPDIQDFKFHPNGDTWVATDGGMSYTTDNFTNTDNYFSRTSGIIGSDMWGFDQGWNEDIIVGGRYHNGNTAIADFYGDKALRMGGAESPTGWVLQGKSRQVAFNDLGNGWTLPETAEGQPGERFIFSKYPNMDEYGGRRGNMAFHPNYYDIIYLGEGNGIWKSTDMGQSYDLLHDFSQRVRYLQVSYHNPQVIYADVVSRGLYRSEDGGMTWELKPSLTSGDYGNSYWKGKLFFAISPTDENTIYACLQNGTWSDDIGEIYKSTDGGDTWEDWTGSLNEYTKNIIIQPDANGDDLLYLFSIARNGQSASVYKRSTEMSDWEAFNTGYPAGNSVNLALPFFRDSKLRVAGNSGVWESPMAEEEFLPIINPWVNKPVNNCMLDTIIFDDHSILNHEGVSWEWEITPAPIYIENENIRNPKVVLGNPGSYDISLSVTKNGSTYTKTILEMVTTTTCPSIDNCFNPAELPKNIWELIYVDSEETNYPGTAVMAFDDDPSTIWHTRWSSGNDTYPHEIQVSLGEVYKIFSFTYLPRQDGQNGRIKEYELYISEDDQDWGLPVSIGEFENSGGPQTITLDESKIGQYFRLVALSEVNDNEWASAAEFSIIGCTDLTSTYNENKYEDLKAFPIPSSGLVNISLPGIGSYSYSLISSFGKVLEVGKLESKGEYTSFDLSNYMTGIYIVQMKNEQGIVYRVKVVKE